MAQQVDNGQSPPGLALERVAAEEIAHAAAFLQYRGGSVHRGVHQARKSLRRARAVLRLGGNALEPGAAAVDVALRDVVRSLSGARDADAVVKMLGRLLRREEREAERAALQRAQRVARRGRVDVLRAALADDPGFGRRREVLRQAAERLGELPWDAVDAADLMEVLAAGSRRVARAAKRAQASGLDDDWHRWRRRARRLAQKQTLLAGIGLPVEVARGDADLVRMLGQAQDYALLRAHCGKGSAFAREDRRRLKRLADAGLSRLRRRIAAAGARRQ